VATVDGATERAARPDQVRVTHELIEGAWPHTGRQRLQARRWGKYRLLGVGLAGGSFGGLAGCHVAMLQAGGGDVAIDAT